MVVGLKGSTPKQIEGQGGARALQEELIACVKCASLSEWREHQVSCSCEPLPPPARELSRGKPQSCMTLGRQQDEMKRRSVCVHGPLELPESEHHWRV